MNFKKRIKQAVPLTVTAFMAVMSFGNPAQAQSYGHVQAEKENRYYSNLYYERAYQEQRQAELSNSYSNGYGSSNQGRVQAEQKNATTTIHTLTNGIKNSGKRNATTPTMTTTLLGEFPQLTKIIVDRPRFTQAGFLGSLPGVAAAAACRFKRSSTKEY